MTVETELCVVERNWTGGETQFSTGFKAKSKAYVKVGVKQPDPVLPTPLQLGLHYDVTLAADDMVTVIPLALPPAPATLVIERQTAATQGTNFEDLARYSADVHEDLYDVCAMRDAELSGRVGRLYGDFEDFANAIEAMLALLQQGTPINVPVFETRLAASQATIDASVRSVQCRGRDVAGDFGGGEWKRVTGNPGHLAINFRSVDRFTAIGAVDATNGGYWQFVPEDGVVRPEHFGAIGNDSDASASANATALAALWAYAGARQALVTAPHLTIFVGGAYRTNAQGFLGDNVTPVHNFTIVGHGMIKAESGMPVGTNKGLLQISLGRHFKLEGVTFDGNRSTRTLVDEQTAHLLNLAGPAYFRVTGVTCRDGPMDGMLINAGNAAVYGTFPQNGVIENCFCQNNFRNNLSLINWSESIIIRGGDYSFANGAALGPWAGIDCEPDAGALPSYGLVIEDVRARGNDGVGIVVSNISGGETDTVIRNCTCIDNELGGIACYTGRHVIDGNIVRGCGKGTAFPANGGIYSNAPTGLGTAGSARIVNNIVDDCNSHANNASIVSSSPRTLIANNIITNALSRGIFTNASAVAIVRDNTIDVAVGRGIDVEGADSDVNGNRVANVSALSEAAIRATGGNALVTGNHLFGAGAGKAIKVGSSAKVVRYNICQGFDATDAFDVVGGSWAAINIGYNVGGTANSLLASRNPSPVA